MDRPKSLVGVFGGVAGRVASGGAAAFAPQMPRATRSKPEVILIISQNMFFPLAPISGISQPT